MRVVEVRDLCKAYGDVVAVDKVSLAIDEGEIFGILGPNGAGKTTTVECMVGLRTPDSGTIDVLGVNPQTERDRLRSLVGVQLQESTLPPKMTVGEAVELYRSFYRRPADPLELMDVLGLADVRSIRYAKLSGGQKQRLSIALALIGSPTVAVLDELTTGLDPQARRDTWDLIDGVRERGVTIVLVTHFMDEAERLCDRVAIFNRGRVVALDSPDHLARIVPGSKTVRFTPSLPFDDGLLTSLPQVDRIERRGERVIVHGNGELVNAVILALAATDVEARGVELDSPSLEDAFLGFAGRAAADTSEEVGP